MCDPCCSPCDPCYPCYPCGPSCPPPCAPGSLCDPCVPKTYAAHDLNCMPQCATICPPAQCGPRFITVQQPPRVVAQRKLINCSRTVVDKHVVPRTKTIVEPKIIYQPRAYIEPCIIYRKRVVPDPKILYYKRIVPDPKIVCTPRTIVEPKEICTTMVCSPKPQIVQIPPPPEYCCVPQCTGFTKSPACSPTGFRVPARSCKSRELRGGVLIANCECLKRNGLQHDCPRSECQGKSCCLTRPEATCCPSTWARRFRFVTMGNKSNPVCPKRCRVTTTGSGCNPCGVDCFSCGPCGPCPAPCEPCGPCGPCGPVCDPSCPPVCDPCGCVPQGDCGPCGAPTPNCMPCYDACTPSVPPSCGDMCAPYPTCGPC
ncbi:hypothetical protein pipiens_018222 [Culex pipiens pipiens]|uniref:Ultrahigh sulfur keratin-associated protein n=1 Tax=Culex pipiens pipiens TaxID=38569 RepID=A0ABD1CCW3_CULPP